jgi:hypothetical protein
MAMSAASPAACQARDAAQQPAAAHRHQQVRQPGRLLLPFEGHGALAGQHLRLVIGVHQQRAGLGRPPLARLPRLVIGGAADGEPRAEARMRARFASAVMEGTKISAATPSERAAAATAAP